jgi:hypothetical protein
MYSYFQAIADTFAYVAVKVYPFPFIHEAVKNTFFHRVKSGNIPLQWLAVITEWLLYRAIPEDNVSTVAKNNDYRSVFIFRQCRSYTDFQSGNG